MPSQWRWSDLEQLQRALGDDEQQLADVGCGDSTLAANGSELLVALPQPGCFPRDPIVSLVM